MSENRVLGERIIILGCPGSGKSTFARSLHKQTGLPLIHLDNIWWTPDRTTIPREEFDVRLGEIIKGDRWILDGDYSRTYEIRFSACDTIVFLDFDEEECMGGITERLGRESDDIPWTRDELDSDLVEIVRKYHSVNRPRVLGLIEQYPEKNVFIFKTRAEADSWLKK